MPHHRPPAALRAISALLAVGALAFAAALMLSDRAPGALQSVFGDDVENLWERIDASERAQAIQSQTQLVDGTEAGPDFVVHMAVWSVVMLMVAVAAWSWEGLIIGVIATFAGSVVIELAQGEYTDTRSVQAVDVLANALGVATGASVAALLYVVWSAVGISLGALFRR